MNFIGDSKLGPYLTFTFPFFKDKKISWEKLTDDKNNKNKIKKVKLTIKFNIF